MIEYVNENKPWEYPRNDIQLFPLQHLLEIRTWETKWKKDNYQNRWMGGMVMGKCEDKQKNLTLLKQIVNIPKEDMEYYNWSTFTHAMDFFKYDLLALKQH